MREFITIGGMQRMGLIKSIQRGVISTTSTSGTATVNPVVVANSILFYGGMTQTQVNNNWAVGVGRIALTNSTTITAVLNDNAGTAAFTWELIEFHQNVIRRTQSGTISLYGSAPYTASISTVDMNKSLCIFLGFQMASGLTPGTDCATRIALTSNAVVTAYYNEGPPDPQTSCTASYLVVEFNG